MEETKTFDKKYEESGYKEQFDNLEYVVREEDPTLKDMYDKEQKRFFELSERLYGQIDGEIDMDLHGNISFRGPRVKKGSEEHVKSITDSGTYILRDGKLVKGKAEVRE